MAHPRACGENFKDGGSVEPQQGSSPRMRGKLSSLLGRLLRPRLIPAHAGKTDELGVDAGEEEAHPRACGENC